MAISASWEKPLESLAKPLFSLEKVAGVLGDDPRLKESESFIKPTKAKVKAMLASTFDTIAHQISAKVMPSSLELRLR